MRRVTLAAWVWAFGVYSYAATCVTAAWFLRRAAAQHGETLGLTTSLVWAAAVYGVWLPVIGLTWAVLRALPAAPAVLTLTAGAFVVCPAAALATTGVDNAFRGLSGADWIGQAVDRLPVAILLYTAVAACGVAAAQWGRAIEAREQARALAEALRVAREAQPDAAPALTRLMVATGRRRAPVELAEVEWLAAAGNYVSVHWSDRDGLLRETLTALEARLDRRVFARAHRSTIVNLARVREAQPLSEGSWRLTMDSGAEVVISRTYRDGILRRLGR